MCRISNATQRREVVREYRLFPCLRYWVLRRQHSKPGDTPYNKRNQRGESLERHFSKVHFVRIDLLVVQARDRRKPDRVAFLDNEISVTERCTDEIVLAIRCALEPDASGS